MNYVPSKTNEGSLAAALVLLLLLGRLLRGLLLRLTLLSRHTSSFWEATRGASSRSQARTASPPLTSTGTEYRGAFVHESRDEPPFWKNIFKKDRGRLSEIHSQNVVRVRRRAR